MHSRRGRASSLLPTTTATTTAARQTPTRRSRRGDGPRRRRRWRTDRRRRRVATRMTTTTATTARPAPMAKGSGPGPQTRAALRAAMENQRPGRAATTTTTRTPTTTWVQARRWWGRQTSLRTTSSCHRLRCRAEDQSLSARRRAATSASPSVRRSRCRCLRRARRALGAWRERASRIWGTASAPPRGGRSRCALDTSMRSPDT